MDDRWRVLVCGLFLIAACTPAAPSSSPQPSPAAEVPAATATPRAVPSPAPTSSPSPVSTPAGAAAAPATTPPAAAAATPTAPTAPPPTTPPPATATAGPSPTAAASLAATAAPPPTFAATPAPTPRPTPSPTPRPPLALSTTALASSAAIPTKFTCDGQDVSPTLSWNDPPAGTATFALIVDDPDAPVAGGWTHWVLFDLPAQQRALAENVPKTAQLAAGGTHGYNSWDRVGYGGPCPPRGDRPHTYRFTLYAVSGQLGLAGGSTRSQVLAALQGRTLEQALLTGTYQRP